MPTWDEAGVLLAERKRFRAQFCAKIHRKRSFVLAQNPFGLRANRESSHREFCPPSKKDTLTDVLFAWRRERDSNSVLREHPPKPFVCLGAKPLRFAVQTERVRIGIFRKQKAGYPKGYPAFCWRRERDSELSFARTSTENVRLSWRKTPSVCGQTERVLIVNFVHQAKRTPLRMSFLLGGDSNSQKILYLKGYLGL